MATRKIVQIDEEKCNGCGLCVTSCAEGAIQVIDGKARLVSDTYCDGLGNCLGECPQDAISIIERDAPDFDERAATSHVAKIAAAPHSAHAGGCPGSAMRTLRPALNMDNTNSEASTSALKNWPVQLKLVSPRAPYFQDADLLLVADCVPFAYSGFHSQMLQGKPVVIGCPKLDDAGFYVDKLTDVLTQSSVRSLTVVHMEVPCCSGLVRIAQVAAERSGKNIPVKDVTITIDGRIQD